MPVRQQRINNAIEKMIENLEFFSAPFEEDTTFSQWAKGLQDRVLAKEIRRFSARLKVVLEGKIHHYIYALVGASLVPDYECLLYNKRERMVNLMQQVPTLPETILLAKYNAVIKKWYMDHPQALLRKINRCLMHQQLRLNKRTAIEQSPEQSSPKRSCRLTC